MQVYAVAHDGNGNFLLGRKNLRGYFFHTGTSASRTLGDIIPRGQELNGGGLPALPGGRLEAGCTPEEGAFAEFLEETNLDLNRMHPQLQPGIYQQSAYAGVYFQVSAGTLDSAKQVVAANLAFGVTAAQRVIAGQYVQGDYARLMIDFPDAPMDNELEVCDLGNLTRDWPNIDKWKSNRSLSWYYYILLNLKKHSIDGAPLDGRVAWLDAEPGE